MARLFITERELNFISDINKEIVKDVIGTKIYYFPVSTALSNVHQLYAESQEKAFDNPIIIDCRVKWMEAEVTTDQFTTERKSKVEVWIQSRDLLDRKIQLFEGDFFSYGQLFFEIIKLTYTKPVYGQVERLDGLHLVGMQARKGQFLAKLFGPTWEGYSDPNAVQRQFIQQRGVTNREGQTGDVHDLVREGVLEGPLTGPKEVSGRGDSTGVGSNFYDE